MADEQGIDYACKFEEHAAHRTPEAEEEGEGAMSPNSKDKFLGFHRHRFGLCRPMMAAPYSRPYFTRPSAVVMAARPPVVLAPRPAMVLAPPTVVVSPSVRPAMMIAPPMMAPPTMGGYAMPAQQQITTTTSTFNPLTGQTEQEVFNSAFNPMTGQSQQQVNDTIYNPMTGQTQQHASNSVFNPFTGQTEQEVFNSAFNPMTGQSQQQVNDTFYNPMTGQMQQHTTNSAVNPMTGQATYSQGDYYGGYGINAPFMPSTNYSQTTNVQQGPYGMPPVYEQVTSVQQGGYGMPNYSQTTSVQQMGNPMVMGPGYPGYGFREIEKSTESGAKEDTTSAAADIPTL